MRVVVSGKSDKLASMLPTDCGVESKEFLSAGVKKPEKIQCLDPADRSVATLRQTQLDFGTQASSSEPLLLTE